MEVFPTHFNPNNSLLITLSISFHLRLKADGPLSDGTEQVFTERAAAFFNALEQATHVNDNYRFGDLEPDIYEEN